MDFPWENKKQMLRQGLEKFLNERWVHDTPLLSEDLKKSIQAKNRTGRRSSEVCQRAQGRARKSYTRIHSSSLF